jgi:hypothetical protein
MKIILKLSAVSCLLSVLIVLTSYFILHSSYIGNVHAQADACTADPNLTVQEAIDKINKCAIQKDIFDDKVFNLNQLTGTTDSIYNLLTGRSQLHPETDEVTAGRGALAASSRLVATLYSVPPVSGVEYFASEIQKFNPVQPAYAQGKGYDVLTPVKDLWTAFRNIAYVGFVIVFVIMGFMIMFRAHISPQAVATVQDSIPRIVVALILVTFSYAIAGLMIDVMFLFLNIVIRALHQQIPTLGSTDYVFTQSVFGVILGSWKDIFVEVAKALMALVDSVLDLPLKLDKLIGFFGGSIGAIVVGIALLFIMFRVFFMLLMAYAMIIILTMAAPFFFLIQALPGNNGAKEWFKQMAANISVFPVTALMFIFAGILGGIGALGGGTGSAVQPGQIGPFPLLVGDIDTTVISKFIAIGFLLMTPSAADMVKKFIGAQGLGGPGGVGAAIGAGIGAGAAVVGAGARGAAGAAWQRGPIATRLRAGQLMREKVAYKKAGLLMPGAKREDEGET